MESTRGEPVPSPAPHMYVASKGLKNDSQVPLVCTGHSTTSPPFQVSKGERGFGDLGFHPHATSHTSVFGKLHQSPRGHSR